MMSFEAVPQPPTEWPEVAKNPGVYALEYLSHHNPILREGLIFHADSGRFHPNASLHELARIAGPEPGMEYRKQVSDWHRNVDEIRNSINQGNRIPPLICINFDSSGRPVSELRIADGNHRQAALLAEGVETHPIIVFEKKSRVITRQKLGASIRSLIQ